MVDSTSAALPGESPYATSLSWHILKKPFTSFQPVRADPGRRRLLRHSGVPIGKRAFSVGAEKENVSISVSYDVRFRTSRSRGRGPWREGLTAEEIKKCRWLKPALVATIEFQSRHRRARFAIRSLLRFEDDRSPLGGSSRLVVPR